MLPSFFAASTALCDRFALPAPRCLSARHFHSCCSRGSLTLTLPARVLCCSSSRHLAPCRRESPVALPVLSAALPAWQILPLRPTRHRFIRTIVSWRRPRHRLPFHPPPNASLAVSSPPAPVSSSAPTPSQTPRGFPPPSPHLPLPHPLPKTALSFRSRPSSCFSGSPAACCARPDPHSPRPSQPRHPATLLQKSSLMAKPQYTPPSAPKATPCAWPGDPPDQSAPLDAHDLGTACTPAHPPPYGSYPSGLPNNAPPCFFTSRAYLPGATRAAQLLAQLACAGYWFNPLVWLGMASHAGGTRTCRLRRSRSWHRCLCLFPYAAPAQEPPPPRPLPFVALLLPWPGPPRPKNVFGATSTLTATGAP